MVCYSRQMVCDVQVAFGVQHSLNNFHLDILYLTCKGRAKLACDGFDASDIPVVINPLVSQPMAEMDLANFNKIIYKWTSDPAGDGHVHQM